MRLDPTLEMVLNQLSSCLVGHVVEPHDAKGVEAPGFHWYLHFITRNVMATADLTLRVKRKWSIELTDGAGFVKSVKEVGSLPLQRRIPVI